VELALAVGGFLPLLGSLLIVVVYRRNLGKARVIPRQQDLGVNVHRTVKIRKELYRGSNGERYVPAASLKVEPRWVD
jgi:hypothetical protein